MGTDEMDKNQKNSRITNESAFSEVESLRETMHNGENVNRRGCLKQTYNRLFPKISQHERTIIETGECFPKNYMSNKMNNRKYNVFTMIPLFLFNEYRHFSSFYFLMICFTQLFDQLRVGFMITYFGPVVVVTTISFLKELVDEISRAIKDNNFNKQLYLRVDKNGEEMVRSDQIKVGDFLKINKDQRVPADLVLLHTSEQKGTAYVRTDQLDGETDWKVRESIKYTQKVINQQFENLFQTPWEVRVEKPNDQIYGFNGSFKVLPDLIEGLSLENTIWANMKVASGYITGIVIYTGEETKIALNSKKIETKYSKTDEEINKMVKILFCILITLTLLLTTLSGNILQYTAVVYFIKTFILFSNVIPISMKVNVEFAKIYYSYLINQDQDIKGTVARNSNIPEELGRIEYLLSDKTGTLTQNSMIFKYLQSPQGNYSMQNFKEFKESLKEENFNFQQRIIQAFMLCNNVSPQIDEGERVLQASSPDEISLVQFAERMGQFMEGRDVQDISIVDSKQQLKKYQVLNNFPFSSERKRMGIIIKEPSGKIIFFLKGADSVMQKKVSIEDGLFVDEQANYLSSQGLRTLVITYKELSQNDYDDFIKKFGDCSKDLKNRANLETQVVNDLEKDMELLGVTGVEDLLQEEIKKTIINLREAGIKVWMLTGDKVETAKCIAISTGFKKSIQKFFLINQTHPNSIRQQIRKFDPINHTLVVTGKSLETIFHDSRITDLFFTRASKGLSVVLCRCAPKQKAQVALYLKNQMNKVVCGIGDGGNDVGMIQCSNVGVGIEGKEGLQAALASDYSVLKFKQILKLIIWHGRLSHIRTSLLANFVIHRGMVITVIQCLFICIVNFVAIEIYNGYLTMCYATIFTNFPIFCLILDEDIPISQAFNYPQLYQLVQQGDNLSTKEFFIWIWKSVYQGSAIILLSLIFFNDSFKEFATITFTVLIIIEYLNIYQIIRTWHYLIGVALVGSMITYLICLIFLKKLLGLSNLSQEQLLKILLLSVISWLPLQIFQVLQRNFFPSQVDKVIQEARIKSKRIKRDSLQSNLIQIEQLINLVIS